MSWCVWWAFLKVELEEAYKASLWVGRVGVVTDHLLGLFSIPEATRMVLRCVLCVSEIRSLSWVLHYFYLALLSLKLPVLLPTPDSEVEAVVEV